MLDTLSHWGLAWVLDVHVRFIRFLTSGLWCFHGPSLSEKTALLAARTLCCACSLGLWRGFPLVLALHRGPRHSNTLSKMPILSFRTWLLVANCLLVPPPVAACPGLLLCCPLVFVVLPLPQAYHLLLHFLRAHDKQPAVDPATVPILSRVSEKLWLICRGTCGVPRTWPVGPVARDVP